MSHPMTDERLAEIKARADAATRGPWLNFKRRDQEVESENDLICSVSSTLELQDAAFIAHARTDIPDLLSEIERLKSELAKREPADPDSLVA